MGMFGNIKEKITQYIEVQVKLLKLNIIDSASSLLSYIMFSLIAMFLAFCIILFMGFGIVELLHECGMPFLGAIFSTIAFYLLLFSGVLLMRERITKFFSDIFVRVMTTMDEEATEEKESKKTSGK